ncbi:MAG: nucleotidyl transferase AbiEii/AbiGii toxin family protein [Marinicaulis sp.]|nr:nucleotidyl transferase AbiEii/AbiGii toxin family protein [Marinicaulis sp.]
MIFLHDAPDYSDLLAIVGREQSIDPALIEKDYWIMHCLYGLQQMGLKFELKGGTSLSKGFGIIDRFSEDIDIQIAPTDDLPVGKNHMKEKHVEARRSFFDNLAAEISIPGIVSVERDMAFDNEKMRSAGIRLTYASQNSIPSGVKEGVLLEAGFDQVTPNTPCDFSSWAYDKAVESGVTGLIDNRAIGVPCYNPEYTLVEKLHAISRKYRRQQEEGSLPQNFMRHYYDVYCLLGGDVVQKFIGTTDYYSHKESKFSGNDEPDLSKNPAFILKDVETRKIYKDAYMRTRALYFKDMPEFDDILEMIKHNASKL